MTHTPLLFLGLSVIAFSAGLVCFSFEVFSSHVFIPLATALITFIASCPLIAFGLWLAVEKYAAHRDKKKRTWHWQSLGHYIPSKILVVSLMKTARRRLRNLLLSSLRVWAASFFCIWRLGQRFQSLYRVTRKQRPSCRTRPANDVALPVYRSPATSDAGIYASDLESVYPIATSQVLPPPPPPAPASSLPLVDPDLQPSTGELGPNDNLTPVTLATAPDVVALRRKPKKGKRKATSASPQKHRLHTGSYCSLSDLLQSFLSPIRSAISAPVPGGDTAFVQEVQFSPDGNYFAKCSGENRIEIWSIGVEPVLYRTLSDGHRVGAVLSWSPDGRQILAWSDKVVRIWDVEVRFRLHSLGGKSLLGHPMQTQRHLKKERLKTIQLARWMPKKDACITIEGGDTEATKINIVARFNSEIPSSRQRS